MTYDLHTNNYQKLPTPLKTKKKPLHSDIEPILTNYFRPNERDNLQLQLLYDFEDEVKTEHSFRRLHSYTVVKYNF